jgi:DASS family divalent anion:Na+ symporter
MFVLLGLMLRPLPMGGVCLIAAAVQLWSGVTTMANVFEAFADNTVWLIVSALMLAQARYDGGTCR